MTIRGGLLTSAEKTLKINWDETDLSAALASKVNNPSITALTQFGSTLRPFFSLLTLTVQSGQQNGDSGINLVVGNANYGKLMTLTGGVWGAAVSDADPDVLLADTAYINSLRTAVLITGVIKATMIDVTSLGAISATIGTVTAATINDSDGNTVLYSHARGGAYLSNIQTARIGWSSRFSTQKEYMLIDGMTIGFVDQSLGTHNIVEVLTDLSGNVTGINLTCKDITITTGGKVDGVYVSTLSNTVGGHVADTTKHVLTHASGVQVKTYDSGGIRKIGWYDGVNTFWAVCDL